MSEALPADIPAVDPARDDGAAPRAGMLGTWWGVPLVLVLGVVAPVVIFLTPGDGELDLTTWLQLGLTSYAGVRLAMLVIAGRIEPLQGVFWLFTYTAMGIASLAQLVLDRYPAPVTGPRSSMTVAILLVLAGCVVFDVAATVTRRREERRPPVEERDTDRVRVAGPVRVRLLVVAAVGAAAVMAQTLGGLSSLLSSRQGVSRSLEEAGLTADGSLAGAALLRGAGTVLPLVALLLLTRRLVADRSRWRDVNLVVVWAFVLVLNLVVNNPIANPRFWFLTAALATFFVMFPRSVTAFRIVLLGGLVASLVVFPYLDKFRYADGSSTVEQDLSVLELISVKDYDQTVMTASAVDYVRTGPGHTYGRQLAGSAFFWVPRSIWADKPQDTGVVLAQEMGAINLNRSAPLWAETYLDLGAGGMLAAFVLVGWASARGDLLYRRRTARPATARDPAGQPVAAIVAIGVPLVAGYEFILLRGSLLQAMGRLAIGAGVLWLISSWWTRRPQAARTRTRTRHHVTSALSPEPTTSPHAAPTTPPTT